MNTPPCFLLDQMLIRVGKYLRIIGVDAEWDSALCTPDMIRKANADGRIFVTRNRHAEQFPPADRLVSLETDDPVLQFHTLVRDFHLDTQAGLFSRCIRCNVPLQTVADKTAVAAHVHPNVYLRHSRFFTCPRCRTVFWRGSHVFNTCRKLGLPPPAGTLTAP